MGILQETSRRENEGDLTGSDAFRVRDGSSLESLEIVGVIFIIKWGSESLRDLSCPRLLSSSRAIAPYIKSKMSEK
jgi:hypothetical protein